MLAIKKEKVKSCENRASKSEYTFLALKFVSWQECLTADVKK